MTEEEKELLLQQAIRRKEAVKKQNNKAKENWDCQSIKLPKGTKQRIIEKGETVNGLINKLVLEWLDNN